MGVEGGLVGGQAVYGRTVKLLCSFTYVKVVFSLLVLLLFYSYTFHTLVLMFVLPHHIIALFPTASVGLHARNP